MSNPDFLLPDRLAGAVWGHLVGDAVGVPYEFRRPSEIGDVRFGATGSPPHPAGAWMREIAGPENTACVQYA